MNETLLLLISALAAYLAGSINFAILTLKILRHPDPRKLHSGNPGVVNVYRQHGRLTAAAVLLLDLGRSITIALVAQWLLSPHWLPWVALALLIGNRYPCFHGFRGGKGVANLLGFVLALAPGYAVVSMAGWVLIHRWVKEPFIASFGMLAVLILGLVSVSGWMALSVVGCLCCAGWIVIAHRKNLRDWLARRR